MAVSPLKTCESCNEKKPEDQFVRSKKNPLPLSANCDVCRKKAADRKQASRRKRKLEEALKSDDEGVRDTFPDIPLNDMLDDLARRVKGDDPLFASAHIQTAALASTSETSKERAQTVAEYIGKCMGLHWSYETKRDRARTNDTIFSFSCAQSLERGAKSKKESANPRVTRRMKRFACDGWLHIYVSNGSTYMNIKVKHLKKHVDFASIALPDKWKQYIKDHAKDMLPGQIWRHIVAEEGKPKLPFERHTVRYHWLTVSQDNWKLQKDPLESALEFIAEHGDENQVKLLELAPVPGTQVLAFEVTDILDRWGVHTQELAMDSTFGTNGANFELFAAVAGVEGSGVPLAFCYVLSDKDAAPGAKQEVLEGFLRSLKTRGVNPEFVLTDKDQAEINAMGAVFPHAKHQLCFWHALRALKQRLPRNGEQPGYYDVEFAHRLFDFISPDFLPRAQRLPNAAVEPPPLTPIPRLRLLINGRPSVSTPSIPPSDPPPQQKLTIRIPARSTQQILSDDSDDDVDPAEDFDLDHDTAAGAAAAAGTIFSEIRTGLSDRDRDFGSDDERSDAGTHWGNLAQKQASGDVEAAEEWEIDWDDDDEEWMDDALQDLRTELVQYAREIRDEIAAASSATASTAASSTAPTEPSAPGRSRAAKPKDYVFCPPAHRVPIMRVFGKHASQHPFLPERHGCVRSHGDIYRDAVYEMYRHCEVNRLCEVWAYLWTNWYTPKKWKLWARAANPKSIPVHRTTMMVEALWRNIKRLVLHMYNRPPLDLANFSIITKALPPYRLTFYSLISSREGGRPESLTHAQEAFKRSWVALTKAPIKGEYRTSLETWTCDCGAQKYHAFLLCKHLVQATGPLSPEFWVRVTRYHIPPFYTVPINGIIAPSPETRRHYSWLSRMDHAAAGAFVGGRAASPKGSDGEASDPEVLPKYTSSPINSSPAKPPPTGHDGIMRTRAGGGAGFELDNILEDQAEECARLLRVLADAIDRHKDGSDQRWVRNAINKSKAATNLAQEIERHENRRTMPVTNSSTNMHFYRHSTPPPRK